MSSDEVRQELRQVLASPIFAEATRVSSFLTFVVEETLEGRGGRLKESVIGVEVFGRQPGYDPKADPIVRVHALRLRAKLDSYYLKEGGAGRLRITIPKGRYMPEFVPVEANVPEAVPSLAMIDSGSAVAAPAHWLTLRAMAAMVAVLALAAAAVIAGRL